jgi:hypothetical protein
MAETKEFSVTVPLDPKFRGPVETAAKLEVTKMAGYVRKLILADLQSRGLLDSDFEPVAQNDDTSA